MVIWRVSNAGNLRLKQIQGLNELLIVLTAGLNKLLARRILNRTDLAINMIVCGLAALLCKG